MISNEYQTGNIRVKGFLFDLDGVLIDSEREYTRIWEKIVKEYPTGIEDFAHKIKGTTLENILSEYYPDTEIRGKVRERLYEEEARMRYCFCPGAEEFLQKLKRDNIPTALYTSSDGYKMQHLYNDIPDFRKYFDVIVTGDDVRHSKPDPEGYLSAAERLGLKPEECAVVEDSLQGVRAGKAAGARVIGVEGSVPTDILAPYCDIITDNLMKL
ncbi:MAG: HAD family phosphatase [Muribaculaceae bacterium]|nr:HAD family phosphatase [Muribaculaceae bacterium]